VDRLTDLGEYAVHDLIARTLNDSQAGRVVGDDAAVVELGAGPTDVLLISTDRLAGGVPAPMRARLLTVQTLSDLMCMGGRPLAMVVAVQIPRDEGVDQLIELLGQLRDEARIYGCEVVGGDTKEGPDFTIVGTGVALAKPAEVIRRTGAGKGDVVAVTLRSGHRWGARWAYHLARTYGLSLPEDVLGALAHADLHFGFPAHESRALSSARVASAGLDLSDGLGAGIKILGRASNVCVSIDHAAVRELIDPALAIVTGPLELPLEALVWSPGYMWENLYTIPANRWEDAVTAVRGAGGELAAIGEVTDDSAMDPSDDRLCTIASDEKFRRWAWEDRTRHWLEGVKKELT
jgi:thiamine-monophosphate kinase